MRGGDERQMLLTWSEREKNQRNLNFDLLDLLPRELRVTEVAVASGCAVDRPLQVEL